MGNECRISGLDPTLLDFDSDASPCIRPFLSTVFPDNVVQQTGRSPDFIIEASTANPFFFVGLLR